MFSYQLREFRLLSPKMISFGAGCSEGCIDDVLNLDLSRIMIITAPPILPHAKGLAEKFQAKNGTASIYHSVDREPTFAIVEDAIAAAKAFKPDVVVALGGGAVMDTAKLVAALHNNARGLSDVLSGQVPVRTTYLVTMPTTAGAGSEVSHGSVLYDEASKVKTGVAHPQLMPDACYIDPVFAVSAPPSVTAGSGFDALSHCMEGYINRIAHPAADLYSLQGIRLIGASLLRAVKDGSDLEARGNMALGSMYAGKSLVVVNTNAVHALAYPVTGRYLVPHGTANAIFLAEVMAFNLPSATERFADVALALGVEAGSSVAETAAKGIERLRELAIECGIPKLSKLNIPQEDIHSIAEEAVQITRLMKNNIRSMTAVEAEAIYRRVY